MWLKKRCIRFNSIDCYDLLDGAQRRSKPRCVLQRIFSHKLEVVMKKERCASQLVALPWVTKNVEAMDYI